MRPTGRRQRFRQGQGAARAGDVQGARTGQVPERGLHDVGRASLRNHQFLPSVNRSAPLGASEPAAGAKVAPVWLNLR